MIPHPVVRGTQLGKYQLLRRLAKGGMAEIYLARATGIEGFEKLVVLKRILPELAEDAEFIRMFLEEARLTATLDHPNIAHVYDIGRVDGEYFFTMEYVYGEDLRTVVNAARSKQQPLSFAEGLCIIQGVAAGLHYAHEKVGFDGKPLALVHRDVSPSNVLVRYDGCVQVVDFGIAKATARPGNTRSTTLRGKICYMSPEQCIGAPLDRRSDIFAVGILLYELTTGTLLFRGEAEYLILDQIVKHDVVPPSLVVPDYPAELERIVLRALCRKREQRFSTMRELQLALEDFSRKQQLQVSSISLAQTMETLFAEKIRAWRDAQESGKSLGDYLAEAPAPEAAGLEMVDIATGDLEMEEPSPSTVSLRVKSNGALPPLPASSLTPAPKRSATRRLLVGALSLAALGGTALLTFQQKRPAPQAPVPAASSAHRDGDTRVVPERPTMAPVDAASTPLAKQSGTPSDSFLPSQLRPKRRRKPIKNTSHQVTTPPSAPEKRLDLDSPTWR